MSNYDIKEIAHKVKKKVDKDRYTHTLGVAYTAAALAMRYCEDEDSYDFIEKTRVAGLLHDNAKCIPADEMLSQCREYGILVTESEEKSPFLLHGKLGAYYARTEFGIEDEDILSAVTWHTTGRPAMTLLEKIIFTADYMEPNRYKQDNLSAIRKMAFSDLDKCVYNICYDTIHYLSGRQKIFDQMTEKTMNYYNK